MDCASHVPVQHAASGVIKGPAPAGAAANPEQLKFAGPFLLEKCVDAGLQIGKHLRQPGGREQVQFERPIVVG